MALGMGVGCMNGILGIKCDKINRNIRMGREQFENDSEKISVC